jgi:hypothetical protein
MMPILASILIKATVVFGVALAGTRLARRSPAAVRHVVLTAAFVVSLGLPIASVVVPTIRIEIPIAAQQSVASYSLEGVPSPVSPASSVSTGVGEGIPTVRSQRVSLFSLLLLGWTIISIVFLLPVGVGFWQVRSLRKTGISWSEGQLILKPLAVEATAMRINWSGLPSASQPPHTSLCWRWQTPEI